MIVYLFIFMGVLILISAPIAVALGFSSLLVLEIGGVPLGIVVQRAFSGINSFSLMAVPFFILAGNIMQGGGIAKRLMSFANVLVGWFKGGIAAATVLGTMFFSTMSGSSAATTAAIGSITIPNMTKKGYPKPFAAAVIASSGELGVILPPSLALIMYGLAANVSIGDLFLAGILPGIFVALSMLATVIIVVKRKGYDEGEGIAKGQWLRQAWLTFKSAIWTLIMPLIILGGIYSGYFTPTEAAVVAVVYGIFIGFVVHKELTFKKLMNIFAESAITSGIILLIVAFSTVFGHILTINRVPHMIADFMLNITESAIVFLIIVNIMILITGMFMEALAAIIILAPILVPVAMQFGVDPVHFGIIMTVNFAIGMITPPLAVNLFVACQIARIRLAEIIPPVLIFLFVLLVDLVIITYVPAMSTWIPSLQ
ncbi:TRAP transporter large permease [Sporosarcina thermotolerans]|uniref:TRAP transporter large permease n=1 Tax=Sporosarcina thermotolerans TaxID=633404 RepID=A0AAW9A4I6_9BACL|nr:TRAP transporter large permease [Sporosarcina thermotolerans]MDW0116206.1 TRAP transporter large permease [Sporosarcina thermotolerans]WHT48182.1 TRAP transporter large permease [Sporosarcina thermotolerans]